LKSTAGRKGINSFVTNHFIYCAAHIFVRCKTANDQKDQSKVKSAFHFPQNRPDTVSHRETSVSSRHETIKSLQQKIWETCTALANADHVSCDLRAAGANRGACG
jgi:hypothetical protein